MTSPSVRPGSKPPTKITAESLYSSCQEPLSDPSMASLSSDSLRAAIERTLLGRKKSMEQVSATGLKADWRQPTLLTSWLPPRLFTLLSVSRRLLSWMKRGSRAKNRENRRSSWSMHEQTYRIGTGGKVVEPIDRRWPEGYYSLTSYHLLLKGRHPFLHP